MLVAACLGLAAVAVMAAKRRRPGLQDLQADSSMPFFGIPEQSLPESAVRGIRLLIGLATAGWPILSENVSEQDGTAQATVQLPGGQTLAFKEVPDGFQLDAVDGQAPPAPLATPNLTYGAFLAGGNPNQPEA